MSRSSQRPRYPGIPLILEEENRDQIDLTTPKILAHGTTPTAPTTPEIYTIEQSNLFGFPTIVTPLHPRDRSRLWPPIPESLSNGRNHQKQTRGPLLRIFPSERTHAQLELQPRASQFSGKTEFTDIEPVRTECNIKRPDLGLGITDGLPQRPSIKLPSPIYEKNNSSFDVTQRFEEKLWRYTSSGNVLQKWCIEIMSWIVSALCMGIIIGVLVFLKERPLSHWQLNQIGLTLNAFIAIFSRISSAALILPVSEALGQLKWTWFQGDSKKMLDFEVFDNASRGPWGALLLLIRTKCKTWAALGAVITLSSLALDPFFQQVIDYQDRPVIHPVNGSIAKVVRFATEMEDVFFNGKPAVEPHGEIILTLEDYFFGNGTRHKTIGSIDRPEIPLTCPTGNCTWPAYETLGMCSQCTEVDELLNFACLSTRIDWTHDLTGAGTESTYPNGTVCGYFLDSGGDNPILMSGYIFNETTRGEALLMRALPLVTNPARELLFGGSINYKHVRNPIEDFIIVASDRPSSVYENKPPVAYECVISWCVKTIESTYLDNTYFENEVASFINNTQGPHPWETWPLELPAGNFTETHYLENITIDAPKPVGSTYSEYGVSNVTSVKIVVLFDRMFPSFTTVTNATAEELTRTHVRSRKKVTTRILPFNPWLASNDIPNHLARLATSFTNAIRSSPFREAVEGQAFHDETFVIVRWHWLSLPLGLLVLSSIFLVWTIIRSAQYQDQMGIWKNSAMATLLFGLPDHYQERIVFSSSNGTPRTKAKHLKVNLLPTEGWRVSGNFISPLTPKPLRHQPPPGWI